MRLIIFKNSFCRYNWFNVLRFVLNSTEIILITIKIMIEIKYLIYISWLIFSWICKCSCLLNFIIIIILIAYLHISFLFFIILWILDRLILFYLILIVMILCINLILIWILIKLIMQIFSFFLNLFYNLKIKWLGRLYIFKILDWRKWCVNFNIISEHDHEISTYWNLIDFSFS